MKSRITLTTVRVLLGVVFLFGLAPTGARADIFSINMYVDDYGSLSINGSSLGSYDGFPAGTVANTINLAPGWYSIDIDYKNRYGTNSLGLSWQLPGDSVFSIVPLSNLRSHDQSGNVIAGLQGDYFSLAGTPLFTVYGEGPIQHSALNFVDEIYEGQPGLWAGTFGPSAVFEERLSGEIYLGRAPVPEPASIWLLGGTLLLAWSGFKRSRKHD